MSRLAKNATDADREVAAAEDAAAAAAAAAAAKNYTLRLSVQVEAMSDDDEAPGEPASITYGCSLYYIRLQPLLHTVAASTPVAVTSLELYQRGRRAMILAGDAKVRARVRVRVS